MDDLPTVRDELEFRRTVCCCEYCKVPCRHVPGSLHPADLARLCPAGQDVFAWAELHLRALPDKPFPTLVPARQTNGHCHWFFDGRCAVHESAPYGCAFFDCHMTDDEIARREAATIQARRDDATVGGLYYRLWLHLQGRGLVAESGDRAALCAEVRQIERNAARHRRRTHGQEPG